MMAVFIPNRSKAKSLTAQIGDAEQQVLNRQRQVQTRAVTLVRNIHQQMTAPATLLLASGIGFVIGELTKRQNHRFPGKGENNQSAEITPLMVARDFLASVRTMYTALPLVLMIKSFYQPATSPHPPPQSEADQKNTQQPSKCTSPSAGLMTSLEF